MTITPSHLAKSNFVSAFGRGEGGSAQTPKEAVDKKAIYSINAVAEDGQPESPRFARLSQLRNDEIISDQTPEAPLSQRNITKTQDLAKPFLDDDCN